jgi:hypothetical protein
MSLPQAVAEYVSAERTALRRLSDGELTWCAAVAISDASHALRALAAVCFAKGVAVDVALVMHAPDFVREQAERWAGLDVYRALGLVERSEQAKAPEPIVVLGPWRQHHSGTWYRLHHGSPIWGAIVKREEWELSPNRLLNGFSIALARCDGDKNDADHEARKRGWVLLDAEPITTVVRLEPWQTWPEGRRARIGETPHGLRYCVIGVDHEGWAVAGLPQVDHIVRIIAHGPQTGPEGERLAMAAALALGFVEGA